ncbi:uncharacterized protein LOC109836843 [Asparagus officinalis]|nr:uncharacterized protein LOC109836843 [Asparagus officinalis]XP_020260459.1 uncharacterized protein LOC109836843 [Asparagus officinalis]
MLASHAFGFHERSESTERVLEDPVAETDEEAEISPKVSYIASFNELARNYVQCDTIIWVMISLLLTLAWGVGVIMLLYLPVRRYVLQKEVSSRKLYVTPSEIVYKATRPSFLPFLGHTKIENHIPLNLVIDVIIEQGCLQSVYGIHTFRIQSIAHGKAAPMDELQVHGVSNPDFLRKIIIKEAAKSIRESGSWKPKMCGGDGFSMPAQKRSLTEIPAFNRMQSPSGKIMASPRHALFESGGGAPSGDLLLNKLEEVKQSVEKIETLVGVRRQC